MLNKCPAIVDMGTEGKRSHGENVLRSSATVLVSIEVRTVQNRCKLRDRNKLQNAQILIYQLKDMKTSCLDEEETDIVNICTRCLCLLHALQ